MKAKTSISLDKKVLKLLDKLVRSGKYRNRSHAIEQAIRLLNEQEHKLTIRI